jgi:hypothetical protein
VTTSTGYKLRLNDWESLPTGEHGKYWDVISWTSECLAQIRDFETMLTGFGALAPTIPVGEDWAGIHLFRELAFYGRYGAFLTQRTPDEGSEWISGALLRAERVKELAPPTVGNEIPSAIIACAKGRQILESGEGLISPYAVALLGGASPGRVRNLMFGTNAVFTSIDGDIPVEQAAAWLKPRAEFWPSIWQEEYTEEGGDFVTVPQASDGTVFHPGLRRRNGYTIGEKGSEQKLDRYEDALDALTGMKEPRWRRPNKEGNWGIVKGVSWVTWARRELNQLRP